MNRPRILWLRLWALFQKQGHDTDMDAEMRSHVEMQTQENIESGMKPEKARYAAMRQFGWVESIKETCREQRGVQWAEHLAQDIRFGARMLARNRGFTALALVMLALGVGATTAILSVPYGMLLKVLPHEQPGRLVTLRQTAKWPTVSAGAFNDWKQECTCFGGLSSLQALRINLTGNGEPRFALCWAVSPNLLDVLGVQPQIGRGFLPDEDQPGRESKLVLLTDSFWKSGFGGATNVIGRTVRPNQESYRIVGVLPPDAALLLGGPPDLLTPLVLPPDMRENRSTALFAAWARLKPGVTIRQAEAELRTIKERHRSQYPKDQENLHPFVIPIRTWLFGYIKPTVLMLLGGALCVLLIAGTNVAGLLIAQGAGRQKEIGLRVALGAGRGRIARQLVTEGALMGLLGGGLGILLAFWGAKLLPSLLSEAGGASSFLTWAIKPDARIMLFSLLLCVTTGVLSGLIPAIGASVPDLNQVLKERARSLAGLPRNRIRNGLLVSEIALSLTLLMVVGLFLKSVAGLLSVPLGYKIENAVSMNVSLPNSKYPNEPARGRFFQRVFELLAAQPGIEAIAAASTMEMGFSYSAKAFVQGRGEQPEGGYDCHYDVIRGRYLQALGIPIRRGRDLTEDDYAANAAPVCLVNETLARHLFANEAAIGHRVSISNTVYEVVGVVGDTRHGSPLSERQPDGRLYLSQAGGLTGDTRWLFIRSSRPPGELAQLVSKEIQRIDPDQPVGEFGTLKEDMLLRTANQRFMLKILGPFGGLAVLLAGIGLYGMIACEVTRRTGEFGIRMALGAQRADVLRLVLKKGMILTLWGIVIGVAAAVGIGRTIQSQIYEAKATDTLILVAAVSGFLIVALAACWVPAHRAIKVDPMEALRCE